MTHLRTYSLAAVVLFGAIAACSPTISDPQGSGSGGSGSGNPQTGAGGAVGQTGSGGTAGPSGSGGSGNPGGTGGAVVGAGTGGAVIGTGTGGAADTGSVCGEPASTMISGGYINNGEICGFAWTATNKEGETIEPPCGDSGGECFSGTEICASGTIPANDSTEGTYTGIMIGIDAQADSNGKQSTWTASGSFGMEWTAGGATGETRLLIQTSGGDYCVPNAKSGTTYSITEFVKECWEGGDQSPALTAATAVKAVALQVNGDDTEQTFDGLCITDIIND